MSNVEIKSQLPVKVGSSLCLKCPYELEKGEKIIGIQWFKENETFYHFTRGLASERPDPRAKPFKIMFGNPGFQVNVSSITYSHLNPCHCVGFQ